MNRLQKKCFVASAGLHLLLGLVLFVGPAFLTSNSKPEDVALIDFVPVKTVDALMSGGGNPNARPPAAAPIPPPAVAAVAPPVIEKVSPEPQPKAPEVKQSEPEPESLEVSPKPKRKPQITTTPVKRGAIADAKDSRSRQNARENAEARRAAAAAVENAVAGIQGGLSSSTSIELKGPGGGGVPYANFDQAVKKVYFDAWLLPDGVTDDSATTTASITIARNGQVVSASIVKFSGNAAVDHSVQLTLDRVRYVAPLPDDAKENQRTVTLNFNAKAKLLG